MNTFQKTIIIIYILISAGLLYLQVKLRQARALAEVRLGESIASAAVHLRAPPPASLPQAEAEVVVVENPLLPVAYAEAVEAV